jgi:hypothetical protein
VQGRTRFGNGDELCSGVGQRSIISIERGADLGFRPGRGAGDEERLPQIEAAQRLTHGVGRRAVDDPQVETALALAADAGQRIRAERRPAHAEKDAVAETLRGVLCESSNLAQVRAGEAERIGSRRKLLFLRSGQPFLGFLLAPAEALLQRHLLRALLRGGARRDGVEEAVEGLGKEIEAVVGELPAHLLQVDAQLGQAPQLRARLLHALRDRLGHLPVIIEGLQGGERQRIDRVAADERLDVEDVAVGLVLGSGRRPEGALPGGALCLQRFPARRGDAPREELVSLLRIRDGDLSLQIRDAFFLQQLVHRGIDAADEKRCDAVDLRDRLALGDALLEPGQVRVDHLLVHLHAEDQRDVDADARRGGLADGGNALWIRGDLDEDVGPIDRLPEALRLRHRRSGVARDVRRDFQRDESVAALVEQGAQYVARRPHVRDGQGLVDFQGRLVLRDQFR